ncbi:MAG: TrmH family RNA methyltransferase [Sphaerochaetaceae bacterium]|nr:TrmH family RNA methyltransferase [Sphaerochaetaceae bacterium]
MQRLPEKTRLRKFERLFHGFSIDIVQQRPVDYQYIMRLGQVLANDPSELVDQSLRDKASLMAKNEHLAWYCADISLMLGQVLNIDQADWDMVDQSGANLDKNARTIYPLDVILDGIRSPFNIGSIFRSADSFGVRSIKLLQPTALPEHPRAIRSARGCTETVAWEKVSFETLVEQIRAKPIFALETKGIPIDEFEFPSEGCVVIGSEELGTSPQMLRLADASLGRVSIPLSGTKGSLNVSVAFGIMMQRWFSCIAR